MMTTTADKTFFLVPPYFLLTNELTNTKNCYEGLFNRFFFFHVRVEKGVVCTERIKTLFKKSVSYTESSRVLCF
jgi:hypothetical protein